ncbi:hypothetical protein [Caloranaerobacter sp. DY30410]|uniref:hypothetical protein n=1 Tax=Caloranaerobacter sp. DY30410 TaxID=3238305 RepID=UPI003D02BCEE
MESNKKKLRFFEGKLYCPVCLNGAYGFVYKARIKNRNKEIFICDECEAVWESEEDILNNQFEEFEEYMHKKGLKPLWSELTDIEEVWYKK